MNFSREAMADHFGAEGTGPNDLVRAYAANRRKGASSRHSRTGIQPKQSAGYFYAGPLNAFGHIGG